MLATSLITMWMTQGLRLMQISTWLGPLVRMVLEMATDVLKWLCLLIVFLLAFAASFYSIFVGGVNTDLAAAAASRAAAPPSSPSADLSSGAGGEGGEGGAGALGQMAGAAGRQLHVDLFSGDGEETNKECKELATKYGSNILRGMKDLFEISLGGAESRL